MNGSEGKIHPACSLHIYLEVAPEVISYNFACRLEEYRVLCSIHDSTGEEKRKKSFLEKLNIPSSGSL